MNKHNFQKLVLLLAANPKGAEGLRLQEEEREIKERLRFAGYGKLPIRSIQSTRPKDIQQAMLDFHPQIVHFSGYGLGYDGLAFEDEFGQAKLVSPEALANLFKLFSNQVECVILNACHSNFQAEAIAQYINYVIGMDGKISDRAAIAFVVGFYTALGADKSIELAYNFGCNAIELEGVENFSYPLLYKNQKVDNPEIVKRLGQEQEIQEKSARREGEEIKIDSMVARYNVIFIGKSGCGKTSLINYLYGEDIGKSGVGKPITTGFNSIDFEINNLPVKCFDSAGLELDKANKWKSNFSKLLVQHDTDKPAYEWFHTIFYCFQVGGARVEEFELDIIRELLRHKYRVVIVLTKSDQAREKDIDELNNTLARNLKQELPIIPVCSVEGKRLYSKEKIERFGKEEIEAQVYLDFWSSICLRLPERCEKVVIYLIDVWIKEQKKNIYKSILESNNNHDELLLFCEQLQSEINSLIENLFGRDGIIKKLASSEVEETLRMYGKFSKALNYSSSLGSVNKVDLQLNFRFPPHIHSAKFSDIVIEIFNLSNLLNGWGIYIESIFEKFRHWQHSQDRRNEIPYDFRSEVLYGFEAVVDQLKQRVKGSDSQAFEGVQAYVLRMLIDIQEQIASM